MKYTLIILVTIFSLTSFTKSQNYGNKYEFLRLINEYRVSKNLGTLSYDEHLEKAAQIQCEYNYSVHNEGGHDNPTTNNRTVLNRVYQAGYKPKTSYPDYVCKENCVVYFNIASNRLSSLEGNILTAYKSSDSHNRAMLISTIEKIGYYTIYDGKDVYNIIVLAN